MLVQMFADSMEMVTEITKGQRDTLLPRDVQVWDKLCSPQRKWSVAEGGEDARARARTNARRSATPK